MIKNLITIIMLALFCSISLAMTIDGNFDDWAQVPTKIDDDEDMADSSGDIKMIQAVYEEGNLYLRMTVYGTITPAMDETPAGMTNRYYYHWILDTDDNINTGFENSEYEGNPTDVDPIGVDVVVMVGWRDGNPNGVEIYDALTEELMMENFDFASEGDSMEAMVPEDVIGVNEGDTIALSAFQEGASDNWSVDWLEPTTLMFVPMAVKPEGKLAVKWAEIK
ncbi:hypothetical protein GF312_10310 [Candidatus Poribacteria bacterium]|nr:hypothetical protein [Candidatus Poribacteria bacterium]